MRWYVAILSVNVMGTHYSVSPCNSLRPSHHGHINDRRIGNLRTYLFLRHRVHTESCIDRLQEWSVILFRMVRHIPTLVVYTSRACVRAYCPIASNLFDSVTFHSTTLYRSAMYSRLFNTQPLSHHGPTRTSSPLES